MGNRSSIVSLTVAPGPKEKYIEVYTYLESKGVVFKDVESNRAVDVTYPAGWTMFRNPGFNNEFYLFDENRVGQAIFYEYDNDKYHDYNRCVELWDESRTDDLPFAYPLPDFYCSQDGYLEIDKESAMYNDITFVKDYVNQYDEYHNTYYELPLQDRDNVLSKLISGRDRITEIAKSPYLREFGTYQKFLCDLKRREVLPLTFEEIVSYMNGYYSGLLEIAGSIMKHEVQLYYNPVLKALYEDFFYLLRYTYAVFFKMTFNKEKIKTYYKCNQNYLDLPTDSSLIFKLKTNAEVAKELAAAEFDKLVKEYYHTADYVSGSGPAWQQKLDEYYNKMASLAAENKELYEKMPKRIINSNDGYGGAITGISRGIVGMY